MALSSINLADTSQSMRSQAAVLLFSWVILDYNNRRLATHLFSS